MTNFYDLANASVQLVKSIPIRSFKEVPLVIPVDFPVGTFHASRQSAAHDGDVYRTAGYATLANNARYSLYVYSPTYPFILEMITYAVTTGAQVENILFEKTSVPSDITPATGEPKNVNRWKYSAATSYVVVGTKSTVTTSDDIADWVSSTTPYAGAKYICLPAVWYILEMTNIGNQTSNVCFDIYLQEQIEGHESAT